MSASAASPLAPPRHAHELSVAEVRRVIFASSLGTVFEWYDFYLYGSLAAIISKQFFSGVNPTAGFIFALLRGDTPEGILRFACAAAAISCTRRGAIASVPTLDEVNALLD